MRNIYNYHFFAAFMPKSNLTFYLFNEAYNRALDFKGL